MTIINVYTKMISLRVKRLSEHAILPQRATPLSAGYDLSSAETTMIPARGKGLIRTGLAVILPEGHYGRIAPRSGFSFRYHTDIGAGVVDSDYRGELKVLIYNHSSNDIVVTRGDRVAQLILEKISLPNVEEVFDLDTTVRGDGGFGSTGSKALAKNPTKTLTKTLATKHD